MHTDLSETGILLRCVLCFDLLCIELINLKRNLYSLLMISPNSSDSLQRTAFILNVLQVSEVTFFR